MKYTNKRWSWLIAGLTLFASCNNIKNVKTEGKLHIPTNASFSQIIDSISPYLDNPSSFKSYAEGADMDKRFYSGRYTLTPGMTNKEIVTMIQTGKQDEIAIMVGNYASITELAGKMGKILEADSVEILTAIVNAPFTQDFDTAKKLHFFMPNTYNFHWNTSGQQFTEKMYKEYEKFWTAERKQKASAAQMTPLEVTTLASIVQLESSKTDEQPKVAGLYLNRLRMGMKLDADPTIVFIKKMQSGFTQKVSRVYYKDLTINSPYNTYQNKGLPPSPICMPNPSAIDAVLNPEKHDYIFFVADTAKAGYHHYAKTLAEQERNAKAYRTWADNNKVK